MEDPIVKTSDDDTHRQTQRLQDALLGIVIDSILSVKS